MFDDPAILTVFSSVLGLAPLLMGRKNGHMLAGFIGLCACVAAGFFFGPVFALVTCGVSYFIVKNIKKKT